MTTADLTAATVELLQTLIRNACVNDGTPASGGESRNADVLQAYVESPGVQIERWEPTPGRASFVARLEGRVAIGRAVLRFPKLQLAGEPVRGRRARFRGFTSVPARVG